MATRKRPPTPIPVSVEVDGKTHHGTYTVDGGTISVSTGMGMKTTQIGGLSPETLARTMLGELVREGKA